MHKKILYLLVIIFLNSCMPLSENSDFINTNELDNAVQATLTAIAIQPPILLSPVDGAIFDNPDVSLQWQWIRPLNSNEVFDVRVWREGNPHYGITWETASSLNILSWLSQQPPGDFFWQIVVIQPDDPEIKNGTTVLSDESEIWTFTVTDTRILEPTPQPTDIPEEVQLVAPVGFEIKPYTNSLRTEVPTTILFHNDILHLLTLDGNIYQIQDLDEDDFAETITPILIDSENRLTWATGLAFYDGKAYISDSGRISTIIDEDDDGLLDWSTFETIVEGLPSAPFIVHSNNSIVFYEDHLYIPVGSITDHAPVQSEFEASILRMNPDGSDIEVIAQGLRNAYDIAIAPNGDMFTGDNSPDLLDKDLPYLPPEEINHIREGLHYGFPDYYGNAVPDGYEPPIVELFTSSATTGLVYYDHDHFPEEYRNGLFVAQWGTASGIPLNMNIHNGAAVVFIALTPQGDTYRGEWNVFVQSEIPGGYFRPSDVTVGADGALYIVENTRNVMIQRVTYVREESMTEEPNKEN